MTQSNLTDETYRRIKDDLFAFRLLPGEHFSEKLIAARMGVSRTPVREALFRLQQEGYVSVLPRLGWQVCPLDFARFDQLYEVRILLEEAALEKLARREAGESLQALCAVWCVEPAQRVQDGYQVWQLDEAFHSGLIAASGNGELLRIHQDITERLRIVRRLDFTKSARIDVTYDEHAAILRRLQAGRTSEAQRLLRTHIEASQAEVHKITLSMLHEARIQAVPAALLG